jgi:hypothetical protein
MLYYSRIFSEWQTSNGTRAQIFQKPILALKSFSKDDSTPSPSEISVPVAVYNFGRLCNQWCQNRDGTAAVGLCTVCALHRLTQLTAQQYCTEHSYTEWLRTVRLLQFHWMLPADSLCGITDRFLVTWTLWLNTNLCRDILIAVSGGLLFITTQYEHFCDLLYFLKLG